MPSAEGRTAQVRGAASCFRQHCHAHAPLRLSSPSAPARISPLPDRRHEGGGKLGTARHDLGPNPLNELSALGALSIAAREILRLGGRRPKPGPVKRTLTGWRAGGVGPFALYSNARDPWTRESLSDPLSEVSAKIFQARRVTAKTPVTFRRGSGRLLQGLMLDQPRPERCGYPTGMDELGGLLDCLS